MPACLSATCDDQVFFCERFVEFLIDLMSQAPTRRYSHALLEDKAVLIKCRMSALFAHEQGETPLLLTGGFSPCGQAAFVACKLHRLKLSPLSSMEELSLSLLMGLWLSA